MSSARTCEVSAGGGGRPASYVATLRGRPAASPQGAFLLEHLPQVSAQRYISWIQSERGRCAARDSQQLRPLGWPRPQGGVAAGSTLVMRLLSLADRDQLLLHHVAVVPRSDSQAPAGLAQAAQADAAAPASSAGSQMDEIRSMLQNVAAPGAGNDGGAAMDAKRALMSAIARSALARGAAPPADLAPAAPAAPPEEGAVGEAALLRVLRVVERQGEVLQALQAAVARLEASCEETRRLVLAALAPADA